MKLLVVGLLVVAACSGSSPPPEVPAGTAGRAQRFSIGELEAYAVSDGHLEIPNDGTLLGLGRPPDEIGGVLAAAGLARDTIRLDIQSLLVKAGDRVILFDVGTGDPSVVSSGQLSGSLALAGVAPGAVTDVFVSHAHSDHAGGLITKEGALVFPAATIHLSAPEWAAFQANTDADSKRYVAAIAGVVSAFEPGAQVLPIVKAVATPGHTPGHSSFEVGTPGATVFYMGDIAHHVVISLQRPAWSIAVDADKPAAEALRQATLARLAAEGTRVFTTHFPFPGVGRVVAAGDGFAWQPEATTR
jgi:glyoxylase-like metal-dependent hydrolase (beta-lactamase superfamily II)